MMFLQTDSGTATRASAIAAACLCTQAQLDATACPATDEDCNQPGS